MNDMTNAIINTISISEFNRGLAGKIFEEVKKSGAKVVMKNNIAECVLLSPDEYVKFMEEVSDARLLSLAMKRMKKYNPSKNKTLEEVMKKFGIEVSDLVDFEKVGIE